MRLSRLSRCPRHSSPSVPDPMVSWAMQLGIWLCFSCWFSWLSHVESLPAFRFVMEYDQRNWGIERLPYFFQDLPTWLSEEKLLANRFRWGAFRFRKQSSSLRIQWS
jgi:hypothetical protein